MIGSISNVESFETIDKLSILKYNTIQSAIIFPGLKGLSESTVHISSANASMILHSAVNHRYKKWLIEDASFLRAEDTLMNWVFIHPVYG